MLAKIRMSCLTTIDSPIVWSRKNGKKYKMIIQVDTKSVASQMRLCQKRFRVTGCIVAPYFTLSKDIMTIMVVFCKVGCVITLKFIY